MVYPVTHQLLPISKRDANVNMPYSRKNENASTPSGIEILVIQHTGHNNTTEGECRFQFATIHLSLFQKINLNTRNYAGRARTNKKLAPTSFKPYCFANAMAFHGLLSSRIQPFSGARGDIEHPDAGSSNRRNAIWECKIQEQSTFRNRFLTVSVQVGSSGRARRVVGRRGCFGFDGFEFTIREL